MLYNVLPFLKLEKLDLWALNYRFDKLEPLEGLRKLYRVFDDEEILVTTSFGTKSVYLIHLISQVNPGQKIYFVDTGFHFEETLRYKDLIEGIYDVSIVSLEFRRVLFRSCTPTKNRSASPPRSNGGKSTRKCAAPSTKSPHSTTSSRSTRSG